MLIHIESQENALSWLFVALVTPFICISAVRISNYNSGKTHTIHSPFGVFVVFYSCLCLAISIPISLRHYHHRYMCAKYQCGTEDYIRRIISTGREFLFLFPAAGGEIVALNQWLSTMQTVRLELFMRGLEAFLCVALIIMNYKVIREPIIRIGLWSHGKIISLIVVLLASLAVYFGVENMEKSAVKDARLTIAAMVLLGTNTGFVFSLVADWVVLHAVEFYPSSQEALPSYRERMV